MSSRTHPVVPSGVFLFSSVHFDGNDSTFVAKGGVASIVAIVIL